MRIYNNCRKLKVLPCVSLSRTGKKPYRLCFNSTMIPKYYISIPLPALKCLQ